MFRNQYDGDVTTWSPQGRLHQVEYAMEAVKLGAATVGLKSKKYAVVVALKRAPSELSAYQEKILSIDDHLGVSFSGITSDARLLSRYLRQECISYKYMKGSHYPLGRLANALGLKMQVTTQRYDRRPYGVGMILAGHDDQGPHIIQTCPSAAYYDCKAMAIGARSQSARTYLQKYLNSFHGCKLGELIEHGVMAIATTLPSDTKLSTKNISIGVVGCGRKFKCMSELEIEEFVNVNSIQGGQGPTDAAAAAASEADKAGPAVDADQNMQQV